MNILGLDGSSSDDFRLDKAFPLPAFSSSAPQFVFNDTNPLEDTPPSSPLCCVDDILKNLSWPVAEDSLLEVKLFLKVNAVLPFDLMPYQLNNIARLVNTQQGGIFCDLVGSGKTIAIIIAIAMCREKLDFKAPATSSNVLLACHLRTSKPGTLQDAAYRSCWKFGIGSERLYNHAAVSSYVDMAVGSQRNLTYSRLFLSLHVSLYILPTNLLAQFLVESENARSRIEDEPLIRILGIRSDLELQQLTIRELEDIDLIVLSMDLLKKRPKQSTKLRFISTDETWNEDHGGSLLHKIYFERLFVDEASFLGQPAETGQVQLTFLSFGFVFSLKAFLYRVAA